MAASSEATHVGQLLENVANIPNPLHRNPTNVYQQISNVYCFLHGKDLQTVKQAQSEYKQYKKLDDQCSKLGLAQTNIYDWVKELVAEMTEKQKTTKKLKQSSINKFFKPATCSKVRANIRRGLL